MARYLHRVTDVFYYRRRVPKDLQSFFPALFLKASLQVRDRRAAMDLATAISAWCLRIFSLVRAGIVSAQEAASLLEKSPFGIGVRRKQRDRENQTTPKRITEVYGVYEHENIRAERWREKTRTDQLQMVRLLVDLLGGDHPMQEITRLQLVHVREDICRLPPNLTKSQRFKQRTPREILTMEGVKPMSTSRAYRIVSHLATFFRWAHRHGFISEDVASGLYLPKKRDQRQNEEREVYSDADLAAMFEAPVFYGYESVDRPENFWVPLIGLFSGMRLNEICQLHVEDIIEAGDGEDKIWCFDINDRGERVLKNPSSRRLVPIHPTLEKIGFLKYVTACRELGHPRLWMSLTRREDTFSKQFSSYFQRFNRKYITKNPKKVFHSFRHMFGNQLKQAGTRMEVISELLGHTHGSMSLDRYGRAYEPTILFSEVKKIRFKIPLQQLKDAGAAFLSDHSRLASPTQSP